MEKSLRYQDVYLYPNYSELSSRSKADISVEFLGRKFKAPWLPANMESVIDEKTAHWLSENDYFYIYHRFGDTQRFVEKANKEGWKTISIGVGVKNEDKILIDWFERGVNNPELYRREKIRIDYVTVDIAHGHSVLMKEMIQFIREKLPNTKIIAGNVATPEAVRDLAEWGADAVKVGIAGGAACSTKNQTGFHVPMFSCVKDCVDRGGGRENDEFGGIDNFRDVKARIPIISDGSVRENGDIPKALVAGATMVMAGSLFAACIDAPGENVYKKEAYLDKTSALGVWRERDGEILYKKYHGSASAKQKGEHKHVEGFETEIPCNNLTYAEKYQELTESMKSAVSYSGGKDLSGFKNTKYLIV